VTDELLDEDGEADEEVNALLRADLW